MTRKVYQEYVCKTLQEVQTATRNLDKAKIVPLQLNDGGVVKNIHNYVGIYNISLGKFCTAVVPHYHLVQHKEYFDGFAEAMKRLNMKFTMIVTQVGNRAFADINFPDHKIELKKVGEQFTSGIRLINSYDKSTGVHVIPMFQRLACSNGMVITHSEKTLSIKHHSRLIAEIQGFIEKKIGEIINMHEDMKAWVNGCMEDSIEWMICCKIAEKLFIQIKHREEVLKRLGLSVIEVTDKKTKKKSVTYVWNDIKQKKDKITRWDFYNAITQYLTHGEHVTPHIENLFQHYAERVLTTPFIQLPKAGGL